jgi:hypothetical protein
MLLLRLRDEHTNNKIAIVEYILRKYSKRLYGNLIVATERKIRIRSLQ